MFTVFIFLILNESGVGGDHSPRASASFYGFICRSASATIKASPGCLFSFFFFSASLQEINNVARLGFRLAAITQIDRPALFRVLAQIVTMHTGVQQPLSMQTIHLHPESNVQGVTFSLYGSLYSIKRLILSSGNKAVHINALSIQFTPRVEL